MKKLFLIALFIFTASFLLSEENISHKVSDLTGMLVKKVEIPSEEITALGDGKDVERIIFISAQTSAPLEIDSINVLRVLKRFETSKKDTEVPIIRNNPTWEVILERTDGKLYYIQIGRRNENYEIYIRAEDAFAYGSATN